MSDEAATAEAANRLRTPPERRCSVTGCAKARDTLGMCSKHSKRVKKYGDPHHTKRLTALPLADRFWMYVHKTPTCWLWTGPITPNGYGMLNLDGQGHRIGAHRFAYMLFVGPIPDGLQLDHVRARGCTNRHCVNPAHLEPVTPSENVRRGMEPRLRRTHCRRGHTYTPATMRVVQGKGKRPWRRCLVCDQLRGERKATNARLDG